MDRFEFDYAGLEKAIVPDPNRLPLEGNKHRLMRVAFDLFRLKGDSAEDLWQIQADDDGNEFLVRTYSLPEEEPKQVAAASDWRVAADVKNASLTVFYRNNPIHKLAASDFPVIAYFTNKEADVELLRRTVQEKLSTDEGFVAKFISSIPEEKRRLLSTAGILDIFRKKKERKLPERVRELLDLYSRLYDKEPDQRLVDIYLERYEKDPRKFRESFELLRDEVERREKARGKEEFWKGVEERNRETRKEIENMPEWERARNKALLDAEQRAREEEADRKVRELQRSKKPELSPFRPDYVNLQSDADDPLGIGRELREERKSEEHRRKTEADKDIAKILKELGTMKGKGKTEQKADEPEVWDPETIMEKPIPASSKEVEEDIWTMSPEDRKAFEDALSKLDTPDIMTSARNAASRFALSKRAMEEDDPALQRLESASKVLGDALAKEDEEEENEEV